MSEPRHAAPGRRFGSYQEFYRESAYGAFPQEHPTGGSSGVGLMRVW